MLSIIEPELQRKRACHCLRVDSFQYLVLGLGLGVLHANRADLFSARRLLLRRADILNERLDRPESRDFFSLADEKFFSLLCLCDCYVYVT